MSFDTASYCKKYCLVILKCIIQIKGDLRLFVVKAAKIPIQWK